MADYIFIKGIETNNLRNIDVKIYKNSLNLIVGPSGSGKSSLAYDTISEIGLHEYMSMFNDDFTEPRYRVREYKNMIPTVPIGQNNSNRNIKSTIGTYFGLNSKLSVIFGSMLNMDESYFILNKEVNTCKYCHGIGYVEELDVNKLVNHSVPLAENPIRCWKRYSDFYSKIIIKFCEEKEIDSTKKFDELTHVEQNLILYGVSDNKYQIKYSHGKSYSTRTTKYYGIMTKIPMRKNFEPTRRFYSDIPCSECNGMKFSKGHLKYKVCGKSIGEIMITPINDLEKILLDMRKELKVDNTINIFIDSCYHFVSKANELNLGHLFLNRSIPTLSGGELQRLRLVHVFNSQLSNLLIILDEPVAGLSGNEKKIIYNYILELLKKHTLIVVDHSELFVKKAQNIIALGLGGGEKGGRIINSNDYFASQRNTIKFDKLKVDKFIHIKMKSDLYTYRGVDINIAEKRTNIITGPSGIGKSTLIREYLSRYFEDYIYINQKQIIGNSNSSVATLLNIATPIFKDFATKFDKETDFFSNSNGKEGACRTCNGSGIIEYSNTKLLCNECSGLGFNAGLNKFKILDKSILDIWRMTIDEGVEFFDVANRKISKSLKVASGLSLGHLKIGQLTATLSGGENIRIKLFKVETAMAKYIGIDEPFKGLNPSEIFLVVKYLIKLRNKGKTIIVVDHREIAIPFFDNHISLDVEKDIILGRKYELNMSIMEGK